MLQRHWTLSKLNPRMATMLALVLSACIATLILVSKISLQFHIGFAIPLFLCAWARSRRLLWSLAAFALAMAIYAALKGPSTQTTNPSMFYFNRVISILTLIACAGVTHLLIGLIESLETQHDRLITVLATVPVGVTIADTHAHTILYNDAAARMLGVEPDRNYDLDEMSERFAKTEQGDQTERRRHGIVRAMSGEHVTGLEREFIFADGRRLDVLVSAAPLHDRSGKIVGAVSGFVDITEQKNMQAQLESQRRNAEEESTRKTRFLAAVSHDIRTPANAINLLAELIERSASGGSEMLVSELPEMARDLKTSAMSLVRLVSDVLDITRFDSGRVDLAPTEFPLIELLQDECRQFAQQAKEKGVEFVCHDPPESLAIRADRVKLSRVLGNLLGNAVKFTRQGKITLAAEQNGDGRLHIRVTDTGPGIAPEHHEQIFDEFFQIRNPQREHEKGSGLGLAICRRLVHAMDASLTVNSKPGDGATFVLSLPPACVVAK
jgi:PAS domain S-box-containing protein